MSKVINTYYNTHKPMVRGESPSHVVKDIHGLVPYVKDVVLYLTEHKKIKSAVTPESKKIIVAELKRRVDRGIIKSNVKKGFWESVYKTLSV